MPVTAWSVTPAPTVIDAHPTGPSAKLGVMSARVMSSAQVLKGPTRVGPLSPVSPQARLSFTDAFGRVGYVMLLVVLVSILWTVWLIIVTVDPNWAANFIMDTAQFDDGLLWLIVNAELPLVSANVVSLSLIALTYAWVGVRMTVLRNRVDIRSASWRGPPTVWQWKRWSGIHLLTKHWTDMTAYSGPNRKLWNAGSKAVDIIVQFYALYSFMDAGTPASLCIIYAALIAVNALSCVYFIFTPLHHSIFAEIFADAAFDMMFAVGMPIAMLLSAALDFQIDRNRAEMYIRYFQPGWFEREIRLVSDAAEITAFRISFDSLRTHKWQDWCIRISMNVSFCYRLMRVVEVSIRSQRRLATQSQLSSGSPQLQRRVPRPIGLLFMLAAGLVMGCSVKAVTTSQAKCEAYPQCVAFAHRWSTADSCPCRAMIDVDRAPKTWQEWTNVPDVSATVSALATSGDLKVLQIINRRLYYLPPELQRCTGLQQLTVEGRPGERSLVYMPEDLFARMSSLMYIHLGAQTDLSRLPSFEGLSLLKTISFAMVSRLAEFPPVEPLASLERVVLFGSHYVTTLPDFSRNHRLVSLIINDLGACCNGFFGDCRVPMSCLFQPLGRCPTPSEYTATRPTAVAQAVFDRFDSSICEFNIPSDFFLAPILEENVRMCDGVLYRQCRRSSDSKFFPGVPGLCYSDRMMVISCMYSPSHVAIRREEIQRGIGTPCDPEVEQWLGCGVSS